MAQQFMVACEGLCHRMVPMMTLGQLRDALALANPIAGVRYDQFGLTPTRINSYRGYYDRPALGWTGEIYDMQVGMLLAEVDRVLTGMMFYGWKGGEYTYTRDSPVHVDNPGYATSTALFSVRDMGYVVLLRTSNCTLDTP